MMINKQVEVNPLDWVATWLGDVFLFKVADLGDFEGRSIDPKPRVTSLTSRSVQQRD